MTGKRYWTGTRDWLRARTPRRSAGRAPETLLRTPNIGARARPAHRPGAPSSRCLSVQVVACLAGTFKKKERKQRGERRPGRQDEPRPAPRDGRTAGRQPGRGQEARGWRGA